MNRAIEGALEQITLHKNDEHYPIAQEKCETIIKVLSEFNTMNTPRPIGEWGEDYGDCLWWEFPIVQPPYCGTPFDSEWPDYHTHFTRFANPFEEV